MKACDSRSICGFIQYLLNDRFPFLRIQSQGKHMKVEGTLTDPDWKNTYDVVIYHDLTGYPKVFVRKPTIRPSSKIHVNGDGSLCLYYPTDLPVGYKFTLALDIIPWTIKWVHYYEIYLRNGNHWIGPEAPH